MSLIVVIGLLMILLIVGCPVIFAIALSGFSYFIINPENISLVGVIPIRFFAGLDSFVFLCIPLFILSGEIMGRSGMMEDLVRFVQMLVGRFRGGMAYVNIFASMLFGGITGAALADVSALGPIEIMAMDKDGYPKAFSAALTATSAVQGPVIPPSIPMVIFASLTNVSIGALFLGGIIPGILIGLCQAAVVFIFAKRRNFPKHDVTLSFGDKLKVTKAAVFALIMPIIILGGILSGIFTPTEAACIAAVYALIISTLYYRKIPIKDFKDILINTAKTSASIYLIVAFAMIVSWVLAMEHLPLIIREFFVGHDFNKNTVLFMIFLLLLFNGMWLSDVAQLILFAPLFTPIVVSLGVDPVHFGVIMVVSVMIGLITPPYGCALYLAAIIADVQLNEILKESWPFIIGSIVALFIATYIPDTVLFLPRIFGLIQ